jgi:hypothetical protein
LGHNLRPVLPPPPPHPQAYFTINDVIGVEGFTTVMASAMDTTAIDEQPRRNASPHMSIFFVATILVGTYFITNLYAGVIVQSYSRSNGTAYMTEQQREWVIAKLHVSVCAVGWTRGAAKPSSHPMQLRVHTSSRAGAECV